MEKEVWNKIAPEWDRFRTKPFPETVLTLANKWKPGKILDLGCGNARNLTPFSEKEFECYGIDFSEDMIELAKKRLKAEFKVGDILKIPYEDNYFDYIICVAAFHHVKKEDQKKGLQEIRRVLKPGGKLYLTCWNKWQKRFLFSEKEAKIPWKIKDKTYYRYNYLFNYFELRRLVKKAEFNIEKISGIVGKNIEIIASN
jgi:tRNA (uracil-5-)-methyltransferase TRM9